MKKLFTLSLMALFFIGCSSDDSATVNPTEPEPIADNKLYIYADHAISGTYFMEQIDGSIEQTGLPVPTITSSSFIYQITNGDYVRGMKFTNGEAGNKLKVKLNNSVKEIILDAACCYEVTFTTLNGTAIVESVTKVDC
ncbi:hypothetical protein [Flavobacterium sp.]|uniref:hypothetical protein n=1 Tax=Flavobacterium sp. TaxID=239 RepID=UPI0040349946